MLTTRKRFWIIPVVALLSGWAANTHADETSAATDTAPAEKNDAQLDSRQTALTARYTLKAQNRGKALEAIQGLAEAAGGFLMRLGDNQLTVKVPPHKLSDLGKEIAGLGIVIEKALQREDLTDEGARLEALLRSKREILVKVKALLRMANFSSTLDVERTLNQLVSEIEGVQGQLRVLRERVSYAAVVVSFRVEERDRYVYVNSPFAWLNGVHLDAFLEEFNDD